MRLLFFFFQKEKMSCLNCLKINEEKCVFARGRQQMFFFLLNIVLNIKKFAAEYCCCKDSFQICLVCQAKYFYRDYEYKIYKNNLDLSRLTIIDSHFAYCLINEEHIDCTAIGLIDNITIFLCDIVLILLKIKKLTKLKKIDVKL